MKLTKILLVVIAILLVILLAFLPVAKNQSETAGPLAFAGNISEEEKKVWLEDYLSGLKLMESGDYDTAIEVFDNCIAIDPNNPSAYTARGDAFNAIGDYENSIWNSQAALFLYDGNPISEFEFAPIQEETAPVIVTQPEETEAKSQKQYISSEDAEWKDSEYRLAKAARYSDGKLIRVYTFQYDDTNCINGYKEDYYEDNGKVFFTDVWEYTYNENGQILKEYNPSHSNQTTYEYTYENGVPVKCLMSLEGLGYRTYSIESDANGTVVSIEGKGVYDPDYGFEISYVYDSTGKIPISSTGSETMSKRPTEELIDYTYYPALMFIDKVSQTPGFNTSVYSSFRINDFQLASLPDFSVPNGGFHGESDEGLVTEIYDHYNNLVWELSYEPKAASESAQEKSQNRRIARINEYNSKGVTETNTFDYDRDGFLTGYTTTYYENGNIVDKDVWTFDYNDEGRVFDERRESKNEGYYGYTHIHDREIAGYQTYYGRGIQQQFYYEYDDKGYITGMTGEGIHDLFYESDIEYTRDQSGRVTGCTGTVSSTENAEYQISKRYDYSYAGVVIVEDSSMLNGTPLPVSNYLRVDMPEYIGLPEVVYYADDEIITDEDGYIVKILDKSGALRCELIFDYC